MSKTQVVNIKTQEYDIYIGRPGLFGNPFIMKRESDRDKVCDQYEMYFRKRVEKDLAFRNSVIELAGKSLGCYCFPKRCHGDTIVDYLRNLE